MMKLHTVILLTGLSFGGHCQEVAGPESATTADLIATGNKLLQEGFFSSAGNVWKQVCLLDSNNSNAQFKLGLCYRNGLDHKKHALKAFRLASRSLIMNYSFNSATETAAPNDVLFFLGESYLANDMPDSAIEQFILYQSYFSEETPIKTDLQILNCINAKRMKKTVRDVNFTRLGQGVNSEFAETHPVATLDNNLLLFSSRRLRTDESNKDKMDKVYGQYHQDIYISTRQGNAWTEASLFPLSDDWDEAPLAISKDGLTVYFKSNKGGNENIYQSNYEGGVWRKPKSPEAKINSKANETGFSISEDGNTIYYVSDALGGEGGFDIYLVQKKANGKWGTPQNLGSKINTEHHETSVFIHPTGNTLFWSSNGYLGKGMGGFDVYYSEKQSDGSWGEPQNMGYPINSSGDDLHYYVGGGGTRFYTRPSDESSVDVFEITGGGFEFENLDLSTEVVTLTQEMAVAEILEVEKEVQTEVEVLDLSILDQFEDETASEVEEIDLGGLESEDSASAESSTEDEYPDINVAGMNLNKLDPLDRDSIINLVQNWLAEATEPTEVIFTNSGVIYFEKSSRAITSESATLLDQVAEKLKADKSLKVSLAGHTDQSGSWEGNFRISSERAWEAYHYLRKKGITNDRLIWYGKGSSEPAASNTLEEGQKLNRRVEIRIIE